MHVSNSRRRAAVTAEEVDVHSRWRKVLVCYGRPRAAKAVKRRTNRRERREAAAEVRKAAW